MKNISTKSKGNLKIKFNKSLLQYAKYILISLVVFFLILFSLITPSKYIQYSFQGITLWVKNVLPSLFPFFVFSKIILDLNLLEPLTKILYPITKKLFKTNRASCNIFLLSIISGYPISSKLIVDAYKSNIISYEDVIKLNSYTSMSGPLFIVGTVGITMLKNQNYGYILYLGQLIGVLLNGFIYRNYKFKKTLNIHPTFEIKSNKEKNILSTAIANAITSILQIGGLICIFYISLNAINGLFNLPPIIAGIIELTNGCNSISLAINSNMIKVLLCSVLLSFGGLCIHAQCMDYLSEINFPYKIFLLQKITQIFTSTFSTFITYKILI